jgi:hypothetical protein
MLKKLQENKLKLLQKAEDIIKNDEENKQAISVDLDKRINLSSFSKTIGGIKEEGRNALQNKLKGILQNNHAETKLLTFLEDKSLFKLPIKDSSKLINYFNIQAISKIGNELLNKIPSNYEKENKKYEEEIAKLIELKMEQLVESINEKNHNETITNNENIDQLLEQLMDKLKEEKTSFSNIRHLQNEEIREMFLYSLKNVKDELNIVSPWISESVVDKEFLSLVEDALKRKVSVKILYGIQDGNYSGNSRNDHSDKVAGLLVNKFRKYGNKFKIQKGNTHYKLLICDEDYYIHGSYNFLSFKGEYSSTTRNEGAEYSEDKEQLRIKRNLYFNF